METIVAIFAAMLVIGGGTAAVVATVNAGDTQVPTSSNTVPYGER